MKDKSSYFDKSIENLFEKVTEINSTKKENFKLSKENCWVDSNRSSTMLKKMIAKP
jgi:hypothetical protein